MNQREKNVNRIINTYLPSISEEKKKILFNRFINLINKKPNTCTVGILENMMHTVTSKTRITSEIFEEALYHHIISLSDEELEKRYFNKEKYNYYCDQDELSEMLDENFTYEGYSKPYIKNIIEKHIIERRTPISTISSEIKRTFENGKKVGLSELDIVKLMANFSAIISKDDWHYKYLMLAVISNKPKEEIIIKKEFWIPTAKTIYSKISIIRDFKNINEIDYNTLFHITNQEFESRIKLSEKTGISQDKIADYIRNYVNIWDYSDGGKLKKIKPEILLEILSWGDNEQFKENFAEELEGYLPPTA